MQVSNKSLEIFWEQFDARRILPSATRRSEDCNVSSNQLKDCLASNKVSVLDHKRWRIIRRGGVSLQCESGAVCQRSGKGPQPYRINLSEKNSEIYTQQTLKKYMDNKARDQGEIGWIH